MVAYSYSLLLMWDWAVFYCSIYPEGCVTTLHQKDLPTLHKALTVPMDKLFTPAAGLAPEWETVELLSAQFPDLSLEQLLRKLDSEARLAARYFLCNQEQLLETARVLGKVSWAHQPCWQRVSPFLKLLPVTCMRWECAKGVNSCTCLHR